MIQRYTAVTGFPLLTHFRPDWISLGYIIIYLRSPPPSSVNKNNLNILILDIVHLASFILNFHAIILFSCLLLYMQSDTASLMACWCKDDKYRDFICVGMLDKLHGKWAKFNETALHQSSPPVECSKISSSKQHKTWSIVFSSVC